jgi:LacI family transcriptional regulator
VCAHSNIVCAHIYLQRLKSPSKELTHKNIRIKDIAKAAGVSAGTVDRVLHNRGKVSEIALKKVMEVLSENEYKPNLIARTLGSNRTYTIAALLPNPAQDPYWEMANVGISQAENEWRIFGVQLVVFPFDMHDKNSFEKEANKVLQMNPDGVLIAPILYHETLPFFNSCHERNIPVVLFNTNIREANALSFIGQNLYQSGRVAAELICFGQSAPAKFGVLHIDEDLNDSVHLLEKEKGFKDYIHQLFKGKVDVQSLNRISSSDFSFKKKLATLLAEPDLKGIFVSSSQGTATVASFLKTHRKNNIRLVGYDLIEKNVAHLRAGIIDFLIHQKPQQQSFLGVSCLVNHLVFKKETVAVNQFPIEVITNQNLDSYLGPFEKQMNYLEQDKYQAINV